MPIGLLAILDISNIANRPIGMVQCLLIVVYKVGVHLLILYVQTVYTITLSWLI